MPSTIIVVEDEADLRQAVEEYLTEAGFRVIGAADGRELRAAVDQAEPDVVILDIALPAENGLSLARWLRSRGSKAGLIFATAAQNATHRIAGLELGADDYVVKPYDLRELLGRVRSVLRRVIRSTVASPAAPAPARTVAVGLFTLDLDRRTLFDTSGTPVPLTAMEVDLLIAFATRPNRVLSRQQLRTMAQGYRESDHSDRSIDIRITRLRRKIETGTKPALIQTVRGEGYVFVPQCA
ncbi:response regulator transcription factor [Methylobacterium nodulans]|uniref:Two component transcriptional regulator, winged helix family n=1 Tax=Methylobacterium nodulans (strain LMG 21967 / CNCM I-2342 / ORS 2060) TaxID=460265 RepID=B8IIA6_METNO|nr:response regulator transcription factor [Methylobacterium nodulans]ACL57975.1 two component transcriptional regulator, winged helix family [Methylobacterium nodulans ORS 2060]